MKRIFERLREKGYTGGIDGRRGRGAALKQRSAEVFMPLAHRPGEAQADFGEATVVYRGQERKVALFVMTLPFSDALFCQIFPRECTESFQEGHRRAFEFFGGVPKRITYDNTKIAVAKVIQKRGGVFTAEFLRLESHYLFAHHFCLVRRPSEKGHTETLVGYSRRNFMVPVPEFDDFEVFNEGLAESCRQDLQRQAAGQGGHQGGAFGRRPPGDAAAASAIPLKRGAWSLAKPIRCRWSASTATTTRCRRSTPIRR